MRRDSEVVKKAPEASVARPASANFRRHLQGYELGLVTLSMVLTFALLSLPRASEPQTLPLPSVDRAELRERAASERVLAAQVEKEGLPFELRAVGESIRHFGRSVGRGLDTNHDRQDIRERLKLVMDKHQESLLLRLRAIQTQFFLDALRQFEKIGQPSADLTELGADFVTQARRNAWFDARGRCLADEATRRVLFHLHWADLIDKRSVFPFAPSLNDWRVYYRFLLLHPESDPTLPNNEAGDATRLRVVAALSRKDPDYPALFAKGYLFYQLGEPAAAASAFRAQLGLHESGPYALLARNYLIRSLQDVSTE